MLALDHEPQGSLAAGYEAFSAFRNCWTLLTSGMIWGVRVSVKVWPTILKELGAARNIHVLE